VTREGVKLLRVIEKEKAGVSFNIQEHLLGGVCFLLKTLISVLRTDLQQCSINAHGIPLTDEALNAAKQADAILLGAIGGPVRSQLKSGHIIR